MASHPVIDVHAHILTEETMALLRKESPAIGPQLSDITAQDATLKVADIVQKPFPRAGWDLEIRLADMDRHGIDMQVLSVCPQTFLYDQDASLTEAFCQIQNDQIAKLCRQMPDRFMGIASVPLQAPERAAAELRRAMTQLGLKGMQIGSHIEGKNLDDPGLEPLWAAAAELGAFVLVHPQKVAAGNRLGNYYLKNLIGNPLETTIAGASLVFSGVLERYPNLTFCLVHGGGFLPYQAGRFLHGWNVRPEKGALAVPPTASIGRLYFDTILHSAEHLEFLIDFAGSDHILLGSDYPFDMGMFDCANHVKSLGVSAADKAAILTGNPARLLGGVPASRSARVG